MGIPIRHCLPFLVAQMVKNVTAIWETQVQSLSWEDPLRREWLSIPVFFTRKLQGQRSLEGYSPQGQRVQQDWGLTLSLFHPIGSFPHMRQKFLKICSFLHVSGQLIISWNPFRSTLCKKKWACCKDN